MSDSKAKNISVGRAIGIATLIMAASNLLSRLLGFVRVQVLAWYGGTGADVDAYVFSFTLPDLVNHFLAGSALSITFIPLFQKYLANKDEPGAWRFFANLFWIGTVAFIFLISLGMAFTPQLIGLVGGNIGHDPYTRSLAIELTRIILPAQLFFFWGALLNGVQYSKKQFLFPALTPLLYNLGIILCGALLYPVIGIRGFSWGVLGGAFVGNVLIQIPGVLKCGAKLPFVFDLRDRQMYRYVLLTLPFVLGLSLTFSNEFLFRMFSTLIPDGLGSLAALDYSYKLMFILVGLFGQSVAAGIYPYLSQLAVEKRFAEMSEMVSGVLSKTAVMLIPVSAVLMALTSEVVAVLLERGNFGPASTRLTASAFFWYLPGAFLCSAVLIVNRVYYAMQDTVFPMVVSTIVVVLCLPLYWYGALHYGVAGIAVAASICMGGQFIVQFYFLEKRGQGAGGKKLLKDLLLITLFSAVGAGLIFAGRLVGEPVISGLLSGVFLRGLAACILFGLPAWLLVLVAVHVSGVQDVLNVFRIRRNTNSKTNTINSNAKINAEEGRGSTP